MSQAHFLARSYCAVWRGTPASPPASNRMLMLLQLQPRVHRRYPENARTLALHEMRLLRERTQAQTPRFWNDDTAPGPGHMDI